GIAAEQSIAATTKAVIADFVLLTFIKIPPQVFCICVLYCILYNTATTSQKTDSKRQKNDNEHLHSYKTRI
ncbi:hypothetical protein, partial [Dielma fastidiosa]|uniref:hypothetical protein n=1 Tax=Dielma fastidiosa TaxID=1034346 RepID=UPI0036F2B942